MGLIYRYYYSGTGTIKVELKEGKYFGRPFCMMRGVTHGQPLSLTIFNIVVDVVVREVLLEVCDPTPRVCLDRGQELHLFLCE